MKSTTDIDIDVANRESVLNLFEHTPASLLKNGDYAKHNTGVYFHKMPKNPITGLATIDHKEAEEDGFFKLDILKKNFIHFCYRWHSNNFFIIKIYFSSVIL